MSLRAFRSLINLLALGAVTLTACSDNGTDPSGSIAVTLTPASGSVAKGSSIQSTVIVSRTNFTGDVILSVEGAPTGVTPAIISEETSGGVTTAQLTITTTAAAAVGPTTLTVRAKGEGVTDATKAYTLTITAPSTGNTVTFSVAACTNKPVWVAAQDGNGTITRLLPVADVYTFELTGARGSVSSVQSSASSHTLAVNTYDRAKWLTGTVTICNPVGVNVTGTMAGVTAGAQATLSLSSGSSLSRTTNGVIALNNVRAGTFDVMAYMRGAASDGSGDRAIVKRAQNLNASIDLGTFNFDPVAAEAFTPVPATFSITGLGAGETNTISMYYHTMLNGKCGTNSLYFRPVVTPASFSASGFPAGQQAASDYHEVFVSGDLSNGDYRAAGAIFHTFGPKTIALPTALPIPTLTYAGGSAYRRPQATFLLPTEYAGEAIVIFQQGGSPAHNVQMRVQTSLLAGQNLTVSVPDYSSVAGWDNTWGLPTTGTGLWAFYAYNDVSLCQEGARSTFSYRNGNY